MIHSEPLVKHHEPLVKHHETLLKHCETLEHLSFDATISALDADRRYRCRVFGDCGVGITLQMCDRVTNHGDMGTFSKPAQNVV